MTTFKVILGTGVCDHVIFWKMMDFFDINSDRVHLMWSIQSNGLPCMYPIYHGRCGMGNTETKICMTTFKVILGTGVCDHVIFWKMMDFFDIKLCLYESD
mmetsp:Transcript_17580/g.14954  ORF Transcript_17580/g.14954 Transcript_17580/m.14954 type:complete len:100 (+) Transcript_17580:177-476(+)